jgi:hypothetical protein
MQSQTKIARGTLSGAGPRVATPRDPLDARPGWGPLEPRPGRVRAPSTAGGGRHCVNFAAFHADVALSASGAAPA